MMAGAAVLTDLASEIAPLASKQTVEEWIQRGNNELDAMPYLGRYKAVVFARLRNPTGTWTANDLIDVQFLCCAAGYVDVVVGEKRTIGDLRTARGVPDGARLATTLAEAVALIEA